MAIGWPFFDRKIDDPMIDGDTLQKKDMAAGNKLGSRKALIAMAVIVATPVAWTSALAAQESSVPDTIALPDVPGWERIDYKPFFEWQPSFDGADHLVFGRYRSINTGKVADLSIAVYAKQEDGHEVVGYGQGGFVSGAEWSWTRDLDAPANSSAIQITAPGPVVRDIVTFYRIGDKLTGSGSTVKLETLKTKLLGGKQQAVAVIVSSEKNSDKPALTAIRAFLNDLGPIDKLADEMAGLR